MTERSTCCCLLIITPPLKYRSTKDHETKFHWRERKCSNISLFSGIFSNKTLFPRNVSRARGIIWTLCWCSQSEPIREKATRADKHRFGTGWPCSQLYQFSLFCQTFPWTSHNPRNPNHRPKDIFLLYLLFFCHPCISSTFSAFSTFPPDWLSLISILSDDGVSAHCGGARRREGVQFRVDKYTYYYV